MAADDGVHLYFEKLIHARIADQDAAAALARRTPGLAGIVLFCASRADGPEHVARWLGIPVDQVDAILREAEAERAADEAGSLATESHE